MSKYLTFSEVQVILRMSTATLRKLTLNQTIKGYKIGGKILYPEENIQQALKEIKQPQKPAANGQ